MKNRGVATHKVPRLEQVCLSPSDGHKEGTNVERLIAFQANLSGHGGSKRRRRVDATLELGVNGSTHGFMVIGDIRDCVSVLVAADVGNKAACCASGGGCGNEGMTRLGRRYILPRFDFDNGEVLIPIVYLVADGAVDTSLSIGPTSHTLDAERAVARGDLSVALPRPKRVCSSSIKADGANSTVTHSGRRKGWAQRVGQHEEARRRREVRYRRALETDFSGFGAK